MNGKLKEKLTQVRCTFPPVWPVLAIAGNAAVNAGIEEEQWRKQEQKGRWVKNALKLKEPRSRTRKGREELTRGPSTFELRRRLPEKRKERRRKRGTEEEIEGRERMV